MARGMDIAGSVALLGARVKGELAHCQHLAASVKDVAVHHPVLVVKDSQVHRLHRQPARIVLAVALTHAHQHHVAVLHRAVQLAVDGDRCLFHSLYNYSHKSVF